MDAIELCASADLANLCLCRPIRLGLIDWSPFTCVVPGAIDRSERRSTRR
jgi:hypothetical protein